MTLKRVQSYHNYEQPVVGNMKTRIIISQQDSQSENTEPTGRPWREFISDISSLWFYFLCILSSVTTFAVWPLCQIVRRLLSITRTHYCSVSLFIFTCTVCSFCTQTQTLCIPSLLPLFPSHSLIHMQLSFCTILLCLTNTHCICPPTAAESTLLYQILSCFISHPSVTCRTFSASLFCSHSPFILCGPALAWSSGSVCTLACCDLDLSLCRIVEKTKFVRNENRSSELSVSEEMTRPAYCAFFSSADFFSQRHSLCLNPILHPINVQCVLMFDVYFCAVYHYHSLFEMNPLSPGMWLREGGYSLWTRIQFFSSITSIYT